MVRNMKEGEVITIFRLIPGYAEPEGQRASSKEKNLMGSYRKITFWAVTIFNQEISL